MGAFAVAVDAELVEPFVLGSACFRFCNALAGVRRVSKADIAGRGALAEDLVDIDVFFWVAIDCNNGLLHTNSKPPLPSAMRISGVAFKNSPQAKYVSVQRAPANLHVKCTLLPSNSNYTPERLAL